VYRAVKRAPLIDGGLSLVVAILAMYAVVLFALAAARDTILWVVPGAACLALSAYASARLYSRLFYRR